MSELEKRNQLFTAALGEYEFKGFTLNETEDFIELRQNGVLVDRFTLKVPIAAIRNSCKCWLIKNGDFGGGINFEAAT